MGDRGNIVIENDTDCFPHAVFFYSHWHGSGLNSVLKTALAKGQARWNDGSYLARVIFCEMVKDDKGVTGFGISTAIGDGSHPLLCVNMAENKVRLRESENDHNSKVTKEWTFEQFIADPDI
jgi:hypothetical protein